MAPTIATTAPTRALARRGPVVHAQIRDLWEQCRAFIALRPVRCHGCGHRIEAGETVVRTRGDVGYIGPCCVLTHIRGQGACPLCDRARMSGPRCRRCNGTGYGEID